MGNNLTVIGKGAWGSALAKVFGANEIIPGKAAPAAITSKYVILAVEAQNFREVLKRHDFAAHTVLIIATKGIEQGNLKLMGQIAEEVVPNKYAILSGPNFADEIVAGLPAATTIATKHEPLIQEIIADLACPTFRLYGTTDVISTQIGGAVKNVIAIASGICEGKKLGENARAAIITRGLSEITRLATKLGGKQETMLSLCGVGDLMLTAFNLKSRNTRFGHELAIGGNIAAIISGRTTAIEGYYTAKSVYELAQKLEIELPICNAVYEILYNGKEIDKAIYELINRPQR